MLDSTIAVSPCLSLPQLQLPLSILITDQFLFLGNRARIMSIDLDILFDHDYQSTSICRVRFLVTELEQNRVQYPLIVLSRHSNLGSKIELSRSRARPERVRSIIRGEHQCEIDLFPSSIKIVIKPKDIEL